MMSTETDPVSGFSLAAGVLQVVHVSSRALSACREIYKDGSLPQHRDSQEITQQLLETTRHLENFHINVSTLTAKHSNDVIDVSKKCSETATEILTELNKLQRDPRGGYRDSVAKGLRSFRKTQFLTETQAKLDSYREILNTRILSKLDCHALQESDSYNKLDQKVLDLAVALSEGRNTYEQVLATHTTDIKEHIDRRFSQKADEEAKLRYQQQFRDSLFYPEINARQDDIARSHEGTCRWIFGPPQAGNEIELEGTGSDTVSEDSDPIQADNESESVETDFDTTSQDSDVEEIRDQPWSDFKDWLEGDSNEPYWLSGKPGSGKSTLMKYTSTEFRRYCQSHDTLSAWADAVSCSFFFWNLGSSLQKSYVGLLRSLLLQIVEQQPEMIAVMSNQDRSTRSGPGEPYSSSSLYTWTEQRLDDALKRFLRGKPQAMRICIFIDGLDEFVGDEDRLINTIHVLGHASGTKVCASSRPEEIFRQGFAACPQLKLQDLNYPDIHKATVERLFPALKAHLPCGEWELDNLVNDVVRKSQGIFLWADLMTKDLKRGARNADRFEELEQRLERTPDTIDGLYEHMLGRLDKNYLRDAARYFHHLLMFQETLHNDEPSSRVLPPTILGFTCIEENVLGHRLYQNPNSVQISELQDACRRTETRILTRCAGLVETDEDAMDYLPYFIIENDPDSFVQRENTYEPEDKPLGLLAEGGIAGFVREVRFIHKSAVDFLKNQKSIFEDSNRQCTGRSSAVREQIAIAGLAPIIVHEPKFDLEKKFYRINGCFVAEAMEGSYAEAGCCQVVRDCSNQVVDEFCDVLRYLNIEFNGLISYAPTRLKKTDESYNYPFEGRLGFAAHYGRHEYVAQYLSSNDTSPVDIDHLLSCAIAGWCRQADQPRRLDGTLGTNPSTQKGILRVLSDYLPLSTDPYMMVPHDSKTKVDRKSKWAAFMTLSIHLLDTGTMSLFYPQIRLEIIKLWKGVVKTFLSHDAGADPNIVILFKCTFSSLYRYITFEASLLSYLERLTTGGIDPAAKVLFLEVEDLVRSHGGTSFRRSCSFQGRQMREIMLTNEQSNRVLRSIPLEYLASSTFWSYDRTMVESPTQSDLEEAAAFVERVENNRPSTEKQLIESGRVNSLTSTF
ncbi:MAG: hypothetical protein Q9192_005099 [Flavoplaca navasiana]